MQRQRNPPRDHLQWNKVHIFSDPAYTRAKNALNLSRKLASPQPPEPAVDAAVNKTVIRLIQTDTFAAAQQLHRDNPTDRIAVLNHANATIPGGGFLGGSTAQEEDLCHCSTLYETLNKNFYPMRSNELIYSPDVLVTKSKIHFSTKHLDLDPGAWFYVDVISCAAISHPKTHHPNHTDIDGIVSSQEAYRNDVDRQLMRQKFRDILTAAALNGVRRLVLGAFGCGVFSNPANEVARMLFQLLVDKGDGSPEIEVSKLGLREVVIAIYDPSARLYIWNVFLNEFRVGNGLHTTDGVPKPAYLQATIFPPGYPDRLDQVANEDTPSSLTSEEVTVQPE